MRTVWSLISQTFNEWLEDKAERLGAALAYYAAFSMAPLLILVVSIVGFFYKGATLNQIQHQLELIAGANAADAVVATVRGIQSHGGSVIATTISIITLIIGATGVFGALQDAMNTIWEVTPKPRRLWNEILRTRFLSFALVIAMCSLLLISLLVTAALAAISEYFQTMLPISVAFWPLIDFGVSFVITTLLFAMIYKILPDVHIHWSDVWIGAAATAVLFAIGKILLGLYLGRNTFASAYGAAGSFMVILAWVYYSSQILFLGAEFTRVYANRYGKHLRPSHGAMFLNEEARINQGIPHHAAIQQASERRRSAA